MSITTYCCGAFQEKEYWREQFLQAVDEGCKQGVKDALDNISSEEINLFSIITAVKNGRFIIAHLIAQKTTNLDDLLIDEYDTLLTYIAGLKSVNLMDSKGMQLLRYLIRVKKFNVNRRRPLDGKIALHIAVQRGFRATALQLIQACPISIEQEDIDGISPFDLSLDDNYWFDEYGKENGAAAAVREAYTKLHKKKQKDENVDLCELFECKKPGAQSIYEAVMHDDYGVACVCMQKNPQIIYETNESGVSPLLLALDKQYWINQKGQKNKAAYVVRKRHAWFLQKLKMQDVPQIKRDALNAQQEKKEKIAIGYCIEHLRLQYPYARRTLSRDDSSY